MTIQTEKTKMASYVSYILVSNKKQKTCADCILLTQLSRHTSATPSRSYTFTKIFTSN